MIECGAVAGRLPLFLIVLLAFMNNAVSIEHEHFSTVSGFYEGSNKTCRKSVYLGAGRYCLVEITSVLFYRNHTCFAMIVCDNSLFHEGSS